MLLIRDDFYIQGAYEKPQDQSIYSKNDCSLVCMCVCTWGYKKLLYPSIPLFLSLMGRKKNKVPSSKPTPQSYVLYVILTQTGVNTTFLVQHCKNTLKTDQKPQDKNCQIALWAPPEKEPGALPSPYFSLSFGLLCVTLALAQTWSCPAQACKTWWSWTVTQFHVTITSNTLLTMVFPSALPLAFLTPLIPRISYPLPFVIVALLVSLFFVF